MQGHEEALVDAGLEGVAMNPGVFLGCWWRGFGGVDVQHVFLQVMSTSGMKLGKQHCGAWSKSTRKNCMTRRTVSRETNTWTKSLEN